MDLLFFGAGLLVVAWQCHGRARSWQAVAGRDMAMAGREFHRKLLGNGSGWYRGAPNFGDQ